MASLIIFTLEGSDEQTRDRLENEIMTRSPDLKFIVTDRRIDIQTVECVIVA